MKTIYIFTVFAALLVSCGGDSSTDEKELELRERELELREREMANEQGGEQEEAYGELDDGLAGDASSGSSYSSSSNNTSSRPRQKSSDELRQELYRTEMNNPKNYLSTSYDLTYKVFSGEDKITGKIRNSATLATFKDVVLTVTYSTSTGTNLGSKNYVVYDYVYPGSSTDFLIKTTSPKGTKQIGVKVYSAKSE